MSRRAARTVDPKVLLLEVAKASIRADAAQAERDFLIVRGYEAGLSLREIGNAIGFSPEGVRKVIRRVAP